MCIVRLAERKDRENKVQKIFEVRVSEKFLKLIIGSKLQIQEAQRKQRGINIQTPTPLDIANLKRCSSINSNVSPLPSPPSNSGDTY